MSLFSKNLVRSSDSRGFTLIELLVVVAIIGILSSIVLASLNNARKKGRDARRVSDIKQLQLALELYNDANNAYPAGTGSTGLSVANLVTPGYIPTISTDPSGAPAAYGYIALPAGCTGSACNSYAMGAILETAGQTGALTGDYDGAQAITINGGATNCNALAGLATEVVYCIRP